MGFGKNRGRKTADIEAEAIAAALSAAAAAEPKKSKRKGPSISTIIAVAMVVVGAGLIVYPTFSDWWNQYHQSRAIAGYVQTVEEMSPEEIERLMGEAHAYNERLLQDPNRYVVTDEERAEYEQLLNIGGDGVMGYIQINSIGVSLPIYHGVDEAVLQVAIGHIVGSSLPVGGPSTHAAVSGHRGLPSAKLFTDLDMLKEGDTFTVTVLKQTLVYEVDQIRIVLPSDMSDLNIYEGKDYITLITCTPYGVNSHRLLVRGHRTTGDEGRVAIPAEAVQIPNYIAVPAVGIPMLFVYLLGMLGYYRLKGPRVDRERALEELREIALREQAAAEGEPEVGADVDDSAPADDAAPADNESPVDDESPSTGDDSAPADDETPEAVDDESPADPELPTNPESPASSTSPVDEPAEMLNAETEQPEAPLEPAPEPDPTPGDDSVAGTDATE